MNKKINHDYEKRMLSINELSDYIGLGRNKSMEIGRSIGALKKIGSRCLYDKKIVDTYLDALPSEAYGV